MALHSKAEDIPERKLVRSAQAPTGRVSSTGSLTLNPCHGQPDGPPQ